MSTFNKDVFMENIANRLNIEKVEKSVKYKFFRSDLDFTLHFLLTQKKERLGVHIISQFTTGTSSNKIPYFLNKFEQMHHPVLLIYVEDRIRHGERASHEMINMVITNKYGCYIDYDNDEQKIRQGEEILLAKIEYLLKI